ncbi:MAG: hypothetical protein SFV51_30900 [Bryobacteraceae bacterium]|nr:hypothetical protein [Bryobacteraceae bacterium]
MKWYLLAVTASTLLAQGVWEPRAPYPVRVTEVSSAVLNGRVYSLCGILPDGANSTALYIYDPVTDEWSEGPALPIAGGADHCNVAAAGGRLYLLGAIRTGQNFVDGNTYEYDPLSRQWSTVGRMGVPRGASGVAAIGSSIYVAGGLAGGRPVAAFEVFDTVTRQWSTLPEMPTARDHLTAQAVNGRLYAIAGRDGGREFNANEEFDPATSQWRVRAGILTARGGLASGTLRNRIQVFGGEGTRSGRPEGTYPQNEEYDPATDTWANLGLMTNPRHGLYGATFEGRIFAPGGGPSAGFAFSNTHDAFFLPLPEPPAIFPSGVVNAGSFREEFAPGTVLALKGERLTQGERIASRFPIATQLNQSVVRVNGIAVPILYAGPGQINFQLPYSLVPGPLSITVTHLGATSTPYQAPNAVTTAPGLFSLSANGEGQGAVLIAGTSLIARATRDAFSRAARRGEIVSIYCTGLGRLDFPPRIGEPAPSDPPARTVEIPEVTIGGAPAEVSFSGLTPGALGLYQINARVGAAAQTGIAVPVTVRIGGRTSNTVTIAVVEP